MVRSLKNTFAPINRTPPEILTLIPDHWTDSEREESLIKLTHVCHSWREIFISCPLLWTYLDLKRVDKTRVYIERSKSSPLEICLNNYDFERSDAALLLAVQHLDRLEVLSFWRHLSRLSGSPTQLPQVFVERFSSPAPLLRVLKICLRDEPAPTLISKRDDRFFPRLYDIILA